VRDTGGEVVTISYRELKPCPNCYGVADWFFDDSDYKNLMHWVMCLTCRMRGPQVEGDWSAGDDWFWMKDEAANKWNNLPRK